MIDITIEPDIQNKLSFIRLGVINCQVKNSAFNENLWAEIKAIIQQIDQQYEMPDIKNRKQIKAAKKAYKSLGKDPNRYRPSAEALMRRILKKQELYQITTLVDIVNLVSLKTGYSIGGFDADKIQGNVSLGIGQKDELFRGIGRGELNIEDLPVFRDQQSAIGTPTSDEERTAIQETTRHFLMIINDYSDGNDLQEAIEYACHLLKVFVNADDIKTNSIQG